MRLPDSTKDVLTVFKNSTWCKRVLEEKSNNFFDMYMYKLDKNWEANKVNVTANNKLWINSLRIDPQWENKENYYYLAEKISNQDIADQVKYAMTLLETGELDKQSLLKKIELIDPNDFDMSDYLPDDLLESTWITQQTYEKIGQEEGREEAVKYGKWLRGEEKPKDDQEK